MVRALLHRCWEALAATPAAAFPPSDSPSTTRTSGRTTGTSGATFNDLFHALIQQESGGDGTAISRQGALGSTQMLPGTAREMAGKLGIGWHPEWLHSNEPHALEYQRRLGLAYLHEGYTRTGNVRDALRYYHGGPDRSMWGPKTSAYADAVLSRLGAS